MAPAVPALYTVRLGQITYMTGKYEISSGKEETSLLDKLKIGCVAPVTQSPCEVPPEHGPGAYKQVDEVDASPSRKNTIASSAPAGP